MCARSLGQIGFPVVTGAGSHPFPFRTRKLSLPPPMVLHPQGCGRVGRCRGFIRQARVASQQRGLFLFAGQRVFATPSRPSFSSAATRCKMRPPQPGDRVRSRDLRLDVFRGLALVVLLIDHAEELSQVQLVSFLTYAPLGVSTAAELVHLPVGSRLRPDLRVRAADAWLRAAARTMPRARLADLSAACRKPRVHDGRCHGHCEIHERGRCDDNLSPARPRGQQRDAAWIPAAAREPAVLRHPPALHRPRAVRAIPVPPASQMAVGRPWRVGRGVRHRAAGCRTGLRRGVAICRLALLQSAGLAVPVCHRHHCWLPRGTRRAISQAARPTAARCGDCARRGRALVQRRQGERDARVVRRRSRPGPKRPL